HYRGVGPGIRGYIRDVHIVGVSPVLLMELKSRIKRAKEGLQARKTGENTRLHCGHKDFLIPHHLEKLLLLFFAAPGQELSHAPITVRAEAKFRMVVN